MHYEQTHINIHIPIILALPGNDIAIWTSVSWVPELEAEKKLVGAVGWGRKLGGSCGEERGRGGAGSSWLQ